MKLKKILRSHLLPLVTCLTLVGAPAAHSAVYYWDPGSGGNFGAITGTDYWIPNRSLIWTGSDTGLTSRINLVTTTTSDDANFGGIATSGTLAPLGGGTIPVGFINVRSINVNDMGGNITFSGGVITMAAAATIKVDDFNTAVTATISSTIAGAATSLTKTGADILVLSGSNTYTGSTVLSAGILTLGNSLALQNSSLNTTASILGDGTNGLRTTVTTLTMGGLSGDKDLSTVFTTTTGGYGNVTALTLRPISGTQTYAGAIADGAAGMSLIKTGAGTQVFAGTNTYTGSTTVNGGVLKLDYTSGDTSKLADGAALVLGGGAIELAGGNHTEVVASTTLTAAASVTRSADTSTLSLGAITGAGSINFGADSIATTSNINDASGILGAFATVAGNNWATRDGGGNILAYTTGYTDVDALGSTIADAAATNVRILADGAGGAIELSAATTTVNTLLQDNAVTAATINTATKTLALNGIMIASDSEAFTLGAAPSDGTLMSATSGGTLSVHNYNAAKSLTINTSITDNTTASGLTKSGAGTLVLGGANNYTGPTLLGSGTLSLAGSLTGSSVTVGGSAVLSQTSTGTISGATTLTHASSSTSTLLGANSYTGATLISSGALNIQQSTSLGTTDAGTTVASEATLQIQGDITVGNESLSLSGIGVSNTGALRNISGSNTWGGAITLSSPVRINSDAGTLTVDVASGNAITGTNQAMVYGGAGNIVIADPIATGSGALQKEGAGTLTLSGTNTYTGITVISAGAINVQTAAALGTTAQGTMVASGGQLQIQGGITIAEPLSIGSVGVSSTGGLRNISGDNTWSGTVTFVASSRFTSNADTLTISGGMSANGVAFTNPTMTFGGTGNIIVSGSITPNSAVLNKEGSGTVTLTNAGNTYGSTANGTTTISLGTLAIGGAGRLGSGTFTRNIIINNAAATFHYNSSANQALSGIISGTGALTHTGAGALTLSGANSFSGNITVENGTLIGAGATNSPGVTVFGSQLNSRTITVNNAGTLRFNSGNILGTNHVAITAPKLIINSGGVVTNGGTASNNALNNVELNGGTLTSTTGHTSSSDPFAPVYGAWNINGTVTSTGTSTISTSDATKGWIMLKVVDDKTTNFNVVSGTLTVSAPVVDNPTDANIGSLNKTGAGTMMLSAANTYTGTTTVTEGTLELVGGSHASPVTVASGASLGFTLGSPTTSTSTFNLSAGTIKITGTPTLPSYTLITSSTGITGTPTLHTPITGYALQVSGNALNLVQQGGYSTWAAINAIGSAANLDKDGDGVNNAVEYVLGGTVGTNDLNKLPVMTTTETDLIFTFKRKVDTIDGLTQVKIEVGTTLTGWPDVFTVGADTDGSTPGVVVTEDTPTDFDTITLTVPKGTDPKKFARLKATVTE